jgi:hypothetical protein
VKGKQREQRSFAQRSSAVFLSVLSVVQELIVLRSESGTVRSHHFAGTVSFFVSKYRARDAV